MAIFNLGSINIDHVYRLPHLITAGETLAAADYTVGLGGKGTNQSIAAASGGGQVFHIGALNKSDESWREQIANRGIGTDHIELKMSPTGHAIVMVDQKTAENQIIILPGTNGEISHKQIDQALEQAQETDWVLTQNETNAVEYFFEMAAKKGLKRCYSAAPFDAEKVLSLLPLTNILVVNQGEADALKALLNKDPKDWDLEHLVITLGSKGAQYFGVEGEWTVEAPKVDAIDTTGAGDTFLGFLLAGIDNHRGIKESMQLAIAAASLQVTRAGAADAIPSLDEVNRWLEKDCCAHLRSNDFKR